MHRHRFQKVILLAIGLIVILLIAAPLVLMHQMLDHHISYDRLFSGEDVGVESAEKHIITEDGLRLAIYEVKAENPRAVILTLSGIEKPSVTAFMGHAAMFKHQSYSTIMIEMRAHGHSEGEQICLGYKETRDVGAAIKYVQEQEEYRGLPIIIMGLSMGAGTAINAMAEYPQLSALVSLSAFSSCEETFCEIMEQSMPKFIAKTLKPFLYLGTFLRYGSAVKLKPVKSITKLNGRPAILFHTSEDSNVSYANFLRLKAVAPSNVEFHSFEGDEHFIIADFLHPELDQRYTSLLLPFLEDVITRYKE